MAFRIRDDMTNFLCCKSPSKLSDTMFFCIPIKIGMTIISILNVLMSLCMLYIVFNFGFPSINFSLIIIEYILLVGIAFQYFVSIITTVTLKKFAFAFHCYRLSMFQSIISIVTSIFLIRKLDIYVNYKWKFTTEEIAFYSTMLVFKIINFYMIWIYFSFAKQLHLNSNRTLTGVNVQTSDTSRSSIVTGIVIGEPDKIPIYQASNCNVNTNDKV